MPAIKDITGRVFGRLTVVEYFHTSNGHAYWRCQCDCGTIVIVQGGDLKRSNVRKRTRSCGCLQRELAKQANTTHGHAVGGNLSRIYIIWCSMKQRCENPKCKEYKYYGALGIKPIASWSASSEAFLDDVIAEIGLPPPGTSLDRIANDRGYEPGNIRWATPKMQARNRRSNRLLSFSGRMISVAEAAELAGMGPTTISHRLDRGLSGDEACTLPVRRWTKRKERSNARTN